MSEPEGHPGPDRERSGEDVPRPTPPVEERAEGGPSATAGPKDPDAAANGAATGEGDGGSGGAVVAPGAAPEGAAKERRRGRYVLQVRYGALPVTGTATTTEPGIVKGATIVVRSNRGTELGLALSGAEAVEDGIGETVGHVLRAATPQDLERQGKTEGELEPEELRYCRQKMRERGLRMRLSGVEHLWGGERIVFYFTAERRVDFRALVRDLAWHFHTRIELRQIGARDEARLLADFEHCGRPLCCKTFLRNLAPVTMRMAKLQRTTLDPSKISGRCGRLMCCLRFEDAVYRELRKSLPNRGTRVAVGSSTGEVASTDVLSQRVTVRMADGAMVRVPVGELRPPAEADPEPQAARAVELPRGGAAGGAGEDQAEAGAAPSGVREAQAARPGAQALSSPAVAGGPSKGAERSRPPARGRGERARPSGERDRRPTSSAKGTEADRSPGEGRPPGRKRSGPRQTRPGQGGRASATPDAQKGGPSGRPPAGGGRRGGRGRPGQKGGRRKGRPRKQSGESSGGGGPGSGAGGGG